MTNGAETLAAGAEVPQWRGAALDLARLLALALALGLSVGLLLTAAAVALPAALGS